MHAIQSSIDALELGAPQAFENLAVFALLGPADAAPDYLVLDDALAGHSARVSEVSESGSVPELRFENDGERPVLLLDGEELVGAKQNRILNLTILAAAKSALTIPVSCVEAGRWAWRTEGFGVSGRAQYASARSMKMAHVSASLRASGAARSDQRAVWDEIDSKLARMKTRSASHAMSDLFEQHEDRVRGYIDAIRPVPRQLGAVFALDGEVRGIELFDCAQTFARQFDKLLRSWAIDAIDASTNGASPGASDAERAVPGGARVPIAADAEALLRALGALPAQAYPAAGLGQDVRLQDEAIAGGALVVDDRVVHLCAFRRARQAVAADD